MEIWTALAIGFFGSFHCVGMCGPIALALPGSNQSGWSLLAGRLLYNFGRVVTYTLLGVLFGMVGRIFSLAGFQGPLSVGLGVLILIGVALPGRYSQQLMRVTGLNGLFQPLKSAISKMFRKGTATSLFSIGLLNGLLPCGFVYMGIAGSLTTGSVTGGMLYMMLFGFGTIPAMLAVSMASHLVSLDMRRTINRAIPYMAAALGILFILRGLSLGIPFLSPDLGTVGTGGAMHH